MDSSQEQSTTQSPKKPMFTNIIYTKTPASEQGNKKCLPTDIADELIRKGEARLA